MGTCLLRRSAYRWGGLPALEQTETCENTFPQLRLRKVTTQIILSYTNKFIFHFLVTTRGRFQSLYLLHVPQLVIVSTSELDANYNGGLPHHSLR